MISLKMKVFVTAYEIYISLYRNAAPTELSFNYV